MLQRTEAALFTCLLQLQSPPVLLLQGCWVAILSQAHKRSCRCHIHSMASQVRIAHTHRVTIPRYHCMTAELLSVLCVSKNHIPLHFGSLTPVQFSGLLYISQSLPVQLVWLHMLRSRLAPLRECANLQLTSLYPTECLHCKLEMGQC